MYDISIIIVNYNVREFLRQSLLSIRKALANLAAEIFVVDNASNDGSADMVRSEFPEVKLIANRDNIGFARANNQALRQATGRLLVLLNPDTVVQEDTFASIRAFFDLHPETGMAGCKVLNPDGSLQLACRRSFPTPWVAFTRLSGLSRLFPNSRWFGRYNLTYLPENETAEVEAISGSFMAVRREALDQVGLLDEDFFLYGEDLDWCFRMRTAGWKIHYFPGTQIIHFKGESAKQSDLDNLRLFYQAMGLFVRKHFRPDSAAKHPAFHYKKSALKSGASFYKRFAGLISYWLLHAAIRFRAVIAFGQSLFSKSAAPLADLALMQISIAAAVWFRFETFEVLPRFIIVAAVYSSIWLICLALFGCYNRAQFSFSQALAAVILGFLINASLTYFFKQYAFSRAVVLAAGAMNILLLPGWRLLLKVSRLSFLFSNRKSGRTLIVGDFEADGALIEKLKIRTGFGLPGQGKYNLVGLVSLHASEVGKEYAGVPVLTSLDGLAEWLNAAKDYRIQQVIFSTQRIPFGRILEVISKSPQSSSKIFGRKVGGGISFKLVPSHLDVIIGKSGIDQVAETPLLEIENRLSRFWPALGKRVLDVSLAGFFMLVGAPFFLLAWLFGGSLQSQTIQLPDGRSSRLWKFVRGGKLAKWPWLLAILSGKLSWVGLAVSNLQIANYKLPPAVVDVAEIHSADGRNQLSDEEKNKLYLYYLTHYSPCLDLEILLRTIFRI
ncbi:MAG: glycosyltransferase [candidate division KSB1 bacterium]|nr:glycosyltransferase [candidate division KSB1 bacterium]MDZ7366748.1 glycosyltransferase [candidate division KSB1 bacterium]MDZ7404761.1 glycosyltransferase [candidate division KSB1 bacterium]